MACPARHRARIPSGCRLGRLGGEIERRRDAVGILPDDAATTRLIGALPPARNDVRAVRRARYAAGDQRHPRR
jgi:hypothetical protein